MLTPGGVNHNKMEQEKERKEKELSLLKGLRRVKQSTDSNNFRRIIKL